VGGFYQHFVGIISFPPATASRDGETPQRRAHDWKPDDIGSADAWRNVMAVPPAALSARCFADLSMIAVAAIA